MRKHLLLTNLQLSHVFCKRFHYVIFQTEKGHIKQCFEELFWNASKWLYALPQWKHSPVQRTWRSVIVQKMIHNARINWAHWCQFWTIAKARNMTYKNSRNRITIPRKPFFSSALDMPVGVKNRWIMLYDEFQKSQVWRIIRKVSFYF